jgi:hypothetical protein
MCCNIGVHDLDMPEANVCIFVSTEYLSESKQLRFYAENGTGYRSVYAMDILHRFVWFYDHNSSILQTRRHARFSNSRPTTHLNFTLTSCSRCKVCLKCNKRYMKWYKQHTNNNTRHVGVNKMSFTSGHSVYHVERLSFCMLSCLQT